MAVNGLRLLRNPIRGAGIDHPHAGHSTGRKQHNLHLDPRRRADPVRFWLGTKGVASDNVYVSGRITTTSATAPKLPAKGATIYARLWYLVNDTWHSTDYTYTEQ